MAYVGLDIRGVRDLAKVLADTATRAETIRRESVGALKLADLPSQVPVQLALVQDGFSRLASGVADKAGLAEQFTLDPQRIASGLGVSAEQLGMAITDLIGFGGPVDLRAVLAGLAPPGADPELDAALARLSPAVLPALLAGQRPELVPEQVADLRTVALRLGIEHAGPSGDAETRQRNTRGGTEVFWQDFWADGVTVNEVLADPGRLADWVAGTFELDRRLALATGLPTLGDVVATYDFATTGGGDVATIVAQTEAAFPAIADWLPAFLVGQDLTGPDDTQLVQTLAFAERVGWADPGGTPAQRFADAVAYLRANRLLQSALLPTGFQGDPDPLAFFNEPGIGQILQLGLRTGVLTGTTIAGLAALLDRGMAALGIDLSGPVPAELTESLQQQLFAFVASQIPAALAQSPAIQGQFIAALGYLRQATTGPQLRQRIIEVVAAFRTIAVTGPPALTERQLTAVVGESVLGVLGRARLRLRNADAVRKNPEFLLVARQWGIPGGHKQDLGKYKFSWSFDELGVLTGIRRKKKSTLSRVFDTIKSVGKAILESWKDNPFKAIFQVGKIALGVASLFVPGLGLGAAAMALSLGEAAFHAVEGDWLAAIGSGLSAFTAGAEVFGEVSATVLQTSQMEFVKTLFQGDETLNFLINAKRALDIGTSVIRFTQADSLLGSIGAGLGAFSTALGNGGELLRSMGGDVSLGKALVQLGTTARDLTRMVVPAAGLVQAIENGDLANAFGNGLLAVSAGATAFSDPRGVFGTPTSLGSSLFGFDKEAQATLRAIGQGTGVLGNLTRAITAADAGQAFLAGSFLSQAVAALNDPRTSVVGNRAVVTQRIAEVGAILEQVFKGANPRAAAPFVVDGLSKVVDALGTQVRAPDANAGVQRPERLAATSSGAQILRGDAGADVLLAGFREGGDGSAPLILAAGGPELADRLPTVEDPEISKTPENWFSEGFAGMSTELLREQARQFGQDAEAQRSQARLLEGVQQWAPFIFGTTGATVLGGWGATQGALTGFEFGPPGAIVNGTLGFVVGVRKGWEAGNLVGQIVGVNMFGTQIQQLKEGANQSEAMQQLLNTEIYRREVDDRIAYRTSVEQLAPSGTVLTFGRIERAPATAFDGTVLPQPMFRPQGPLPDLMRMPVDPAPDDIPPFGSDVAPLRRAGLSNFSEEPGAITVVDSFGGRTLSGQGEDLPIVLAGLRRRGGPDLDDRMPNLDQNLPEESVLRPDGRPIDNWFEEGFGGISTESLRAQAEQLGVDVEAQRFDASLLTGIQQAGPLIGATALGTWGAAEGAFVGWRAFGPYGALVNGTIGLVVGAEKGWKYGGPAGMLFGAAMDETVQGLKMGANQSEAMRQIVNDEIYRREVEERFAWQDGVQRLAPQGMALSFGPPDQVVATALDGTVIPQPAFLPEGTVMPDGSLLPEESAGLNPLDGAPFLVQTSVDWASGDMSPFGGQAFETREFSFQDADFYYADLAPTQPAESFSDVEMFTFEESSTFDTGDFVYE
ncbi:hypothetical protein Rhe02_57280 [Rhizocola hellebori]|uniref:Uncharacterized protein n=2 Tax=Rhizocola hellebori TaxID=1392758 RepID=A0A8J3VJ28_9ACTN|nr:hypothetical protein Rhe02_57280 [Rhizocola hellebori]